MVPLAMLGSHPDVTCLILKRVVLRLIVRNCSSLLYSSLGTSIAPAETEKVSWFVSLEYFNMGQEHK